MVGFSKRVHEVRQRQDSEAASNLELPKLMKAPGIRRDQIPTPQEYSGNQESAQDEEQLNAHGRPGDSGRFTVLIEVKEHHAKHSLCLLLEHREHFRRAKPFLADEF